MPKVIASPSNQIVKDLVRLSKRSERDTSDLFLIEGYRPITRAMESGFHLEDLYYSTEWFLGENEMSVVQAAESTGTRITQLGREAFAKVTYRDRPEGLLAVGKQWHTKLEDLELSDNPFVLIVESIEKPGNLGTILRSADATGAEAVIVTDPVTDVFNPNVVRASTGVLFKVPVVVTDSASALAFCKTHDIKTLAATPHTDTLYTSVDMTQPIAVVMGSEQFGLSDQMMHAADLQVKLPMLGLADSLNVSAATVVLAYEVVRQRGRG
ncbi:MAG: RNA methyltransferase [Candidatus Nomurabacteria bacterium]|jgi:TrmH family RNA methyltransferase|nr:RNA methyltransferase [Candidatus Nomurabacteria bacterium]